MAKICGQIIWLKLGTEVGCDEIFQKPLWLTSVTFSFGVTGAGGGGGGGGGLTFCPLSTKNPAFQGQFESVIRPHWYIVLPNEFDHELYYNRPFSLYM